MFFLSNNKTAIPPVHKICATLIVDTNLQYFLFSVTIDLYHVAIVKLWYRSRILSDTEQVDRIEYEIHITTFLIFFSKKKEMEAYRSVMMIYEVLL